MRAKEFITEVKLDIPDQTISVQIPLRDIIKNPSNVIGQKENPGERVGNNGDTKWSPPLQQHLDTIKDIAGPSDDESSKIDSTTDIDEPGDDSDLQKIIAIISKMAHPVM